MSRRGSRSRGVLTIVAPLVAANVAFSFQQTAVVPAIPTIQQDFDAPETWSAWLLSGYLIVASIATPLLGKLGDRFGRQRVLVAALTVFLLGSVGAVFATSIWMLIAFRAIQGVGGAVFPLTLAIARDELDGGDVRLGIGMMTGAFGLGTAIGFGVAGVIVELLSWQVLFVAGAAVVAAATLAVAIGVPPSRVRADGGVDALGGVFLTLGMALVLVALTEGPRRGWESPFFVGGLAVATVLLALWIVVDRRADEPLLDLGVLARPSVLLTNLSSLALGYVIFGVYFLLPYVVATNEGDGASVEQEALRAGLVLVPAAVGELVAGPFSGALAERMEARWPYGAGMALVAAAAALLAIWHGDPFVIGGLAFVLGIGSGLAIGLASSLIAESVADTETGVATALNSTIRRVGGGVGSQVSAALLVALGASRAFVPAFAAAAAVAALGAVLAFAVRGETSGEPQGEPV